MHLWAGGLLQKGHSGSKRWKDGLWTISYGLWDLQKNKGVGELKKQLMKSKDIIYDLKAQVAQLKFDVEDLRGFLAQETQAKEYLKKERDNYGK